MDESELTPESTPAVPAPELTPAPVAAEIPMPAETGVDPEGLSMGLDIGSQAATVDGVPAPEPIAHVMRGRILEDGTVIATGRRKTSVARVRIKRGTGKFTINNRELTEYFPVERHQISVEAPLRVTSRLGEIDVWVRADGGGINGQVGAIVLGLSRALHTLNPELHSALSEHSFLTRDDRMVERKKYGHKKARRSFQFSKR